VVRRPGSRIAKTVSGFGLIHNVLHVMAFTMRGETIRVISLRKANSMENRRYGGK
jgi:uncharacterized DUF497 family protein